MVNSSGFAVAERPRGGSCVSAPIIPARSQAMPRSQQLRYLLTDEALTAPLNTYKPVKPQSFWAQNLPILPSCATACILTKMGADVPRELQIFKPLPARRGILRIRPLAMDRTKRIVDRQSKGFSLIEKLKERERLLVSLLKESEIY